MLQARSNIGLDRLRKGERDGRAMRRLAKKQFIVGVADIASFKQHGRGRGAPEDVKRRKTVRLRPQLEPPSRLFDQS